MKIRKNLGNLQHLKLKHFANYSNANLITFLQPISSREGGIRQMERPETLKDYTKIVVETDETNPETIATITKDDVFVAYGYRVRMTPKYD